MGSSCCKCGCDPDDFFAYNTVKIVRVRDRYLGILHYLSILAIFSYVVGFVLIYNQGYYETDTSPQGVVRTSLLCPWTDSKAKGFPYCNNSGKAYPSYQLPCEFVDHYDLVFPAVENGAMFISSRVSESQQSRTDVTKPFNDTKPIFTYYPVNIETCSLRLIHSVQSYEFYKDASASKKKYYGGAAINLEGFVMNDDGKTIFKFPQHQYDQFSLGFLLDAAKVNLDEMSDVADSQGESFRYAGLVLLVNINYQNIHTDQYGDTDSPIIYTIRPTRLVQSEFKVVQTLADPSSHTQRSLLNRHGVRIIFSQTGTFARFSFQHMLIQMISALGLLSVSTVIVDLLMIYVMPHRAKYGQHKYELTEDFSDVRDAERESRRTSQESIDTSLLHQNQSST